MRRVVLAGEDPALLGNWARMLGDDPRWRVLAEHTMIGALREAVERERPDVMVCGMGLADALLTDALTQVRRLGCRVQVLVVAPGGDQPLLLDALLAGADSVWVPDQPDAPPLGDAMAELQAGGGRITPWMAQHVLSHFGLGKLEVPRHQVEDLCNPLALTSLEIHVLQRLAGGQSLGVLASELGQSVPAMIDRLRGVCRKLQWSRRAGELALA
ncbi:MAG: hypothetical protein RLY78_1372 [Pseudomonadota bacterium]|jgi:DNA-binding NarL/FixJ family response regulator